MDLETLIRVRAELLALVRTDSNADRLAHIAKCAIEFSDSMRTVAGRAVHSTNTIHLNARLLRANPGEVNQIFAHELAHLISRALYGMAGRGHGALWRSVMVRLGYAPDRLHKLNTEALARRQRPVAEAACACRTHQLKRRRYNNLVRGAKYRCKLCSERLTLTAEFGT